MYIERDEAITRIRKALKARSGKVWSITGGRGTGWGWLIITVPPRQRNEYGYMPKAAQKRLQDLLGLDRPAHDQGVLVSPDERKFFVTRAEKGLAQA